MKKSNSSKLKKAQKKKLRKLFIRAIMITLLVCAAVIAVGAVLYNRIRVDNGAKEWGFNKPLDPINKNVAVFGVDKDGYRTDVIMVMNFNSVTNKVKIVSIPRDTMVNWDEAQRDKLREYTGKYAYTTKINEMSSYSGIEYIRDFTIEEMEDILDINIDNYVIVTTDAFRELVDAIGGVEVEVPALSDGSGLHYDDNYQDLHIHLEPGIQTLYGKDAEGLVRFRKGYAEGDVGRIKTQQVFLDALADKLLSPSTFIKLPQIASVVFDTVTTDMSLTQMTGYLKYFKNFNRENIAFYIVPGDSEYTNGKWYYIIDDSALPAFRNEVFHDEIPAGEEAAPVIDQSVSIEVLNSTATSGLAASEKEKLENAGYTVSNIGNYTPDILETTVIYAGDLEKAKQFKAYYPNAKLEEDTTLDYDIQIVLGNDIQ
ncbi:LCP family protein [Cellulosilyticum ruminicola]|uniref:LCP family protein n=1 Tax=Cellulosilyticum ruminicola TaxID=425254 RepID=UPI0006D2442E|nr:LCP family protein [Cellulosilyticum ruminicola]